MDSLASLEKSLHFADAEEAWAAVERCLEPSHRRAFLELLASGDCLVEMVRHSQGQADAAVALYTLQLINLLHATKQEFRALLALRWVDDADFVPLIQRALTHSEVLKPMKAGFVLLFNALKAYLESVASRRTDGGEAESEEEVFARVSSSHALQTLLESYFSRVGDILPEEDPVVEWVVYLLDLLVGSWKAHSAVEVFVRSLSGAPLEHFFNFLHIAIDETVKSKTVHSLIVDLKAEVLDSDEDFSQRLMPSEGRRLLFLRRADVLFLVRLFAELSASIPAADLILERLALINDVLRALVCISFLGGYNAPLQRLIADNGSEDHRFGLLGRLSDLLATLTRCRSKGLKLPEVPELNTNIIRMACNVVHANPPAQDFILDHGFLPFYLAHTNRDEHNLHAKEATVVFVRYMTESNLRAREMIKALRVEDFILENASFVKKFDEL